MTLQSMNPAQGKVNAANEAIISQKTDVSKAEICFGALMAVSAIAGLWAAVSLLISYFSG
jgi:hypothetical protein